ncbi:UDP-N-acetylmuramoyl-tripeptide--D-alanyl-D- alan ine ligase [Bifidobacterium aquikefiri]|uniref:UDP-N-acetylmuramoyl-tripeptide--D-alanyl-D-alanine ligase n=2 Tax=Bifidobacterium aquikefiri TaxID=1653207 RepID=A0A261G6J9_9BIFI|nr:UDP-N-acetylmuramoyl-tripeptide--D-alanyl-D- alan ine ligase [Bifidobacterium aquikefiri]
MNKRGYEVEDDAKDFRQQLASDEGLLSGEGAFDKSSGDLEPEMMTMSIDEIAHSVSGIVDFDNGHKVSSVTTDSRTAGQGSLFVAIPGTRVDGHDFVSVAARQGAVAALVEHKVADTDITQIVVDDTVRALGMLARHNIDRRRELPDPFTIIGITGSVGKTTTKDLLFSLLSRLGNTISPVGSFNNEIGLPLTALKVHASTRFFTAEMGASHIGDIDYLTKIAPPDISIALIVGIAHLGEFGSVDNIAIAKSEIIQNLLPGGISVLNADDPRVSAMRRYAPGKILWFGENGSQLPAGSHLNMYATGIHTDDLDHPRFLMHAHDELPTANDANSVKEDTHQVTLGIRGTHNVMNALAASAVAHELGLSLPDIADVLGKQERISPHRMAVSKVAGKESSFTLIDDSFNANPNSVAAGVQGLADWGANQRTPPYRVAVLGAMLELGADEKRLHADIGALCARQHIDQLIAVGGNEQLNALAHDIVDGAEAAAAAEHGDDMTTPADNTDGNKAMISSCASNIDEADAMVAQISAEHPHTVVLLKGSHASGLSTLADRWNATPKAQQS